MVAVALLGWTLAGIGWGIIGALFYMGRLGFLGGDAVLGSILPVRGRSQKTQSSALPVYTAETLERGIDEVMESARLSGNPISRDEARSEALEALMGLQEV